MRDQGNNAPVADAFQEQVEMPRADVGGGDGGRIASGSLSRTGDDSLFDQSVESRLHRGVADRPVEPGLSFGQDLTPEGEILEAAPADDVRGLYDQVLAAVREKVTV